MQGGMMPNPGPVAAEPLQTDGYAPYPVMPAPAQGAPGRPAPIVDQGF
jgi:hypothetical protein